MIGTIARVTDRGFGFITPEEGDKDLFFHARSLVDIEFDELKEGDTVSFELEDGPKGPAAINVARAAKGAANDNTPADDMQEAA